MSSNKLLDNYKKEDEFITITNLLNNHINQIKNLLKQLNSKFPPPTNIEYKINLDNETLQVVKKK